MAFSVVRLIDGPFKLCGCRPLDLGPRRPAHTPSAPKHAHGRLFRRRFSCAEDAISTAIFSNTPKPTNGKECLISRGIVKGSPTDKATSDLYRPVGFSLTFFQNTPAPSLFLMYSWASFKFFGRCSSFS